MNERTFWSRAATFGACAAIILAPWTRLGLTRFVTASDLAMAACFCALYAEITLVGTRRLVPPNWSRGFAFALGAWMSAVLLAGLNAYYAGSYLLESFTMFYLLVIALIVANLAAVDEDRLLTFVGALRWSVIGCVAFSTVGVVSAGVLHRFDPMFYSDAFKLVGTFTYSNQLAGFLVLGLPLLFEDAIGRGPLSRRLLAIPLSVAAFVCITATGSRTGLIAATFVCLIYGAIFIARLRPATLITALVIVVAGYIVVSRSALSSGGAAERAFGGLQTVLVDRQFTDQWRKENWANGFDVFAHSLFSGFGPGNIEAEYQYEIHNTYLSVFAETGIVGGIAFLSLIGFVLTRAVRSYGAARRAHADELAGIARALSVALIGQLLYATQQLVISMRHVWIAFALAIATAVVIQRKAQVARAATSTPELVCAG